MSITTSGNFDGDRMARRTRETVLRKINHAEKIANETPTVAYDDEFWSNFENSCAEVVARKCELLQAGDYHSAAIELSEFELFGVRLGIDKLRRRVEQAVDPNVIQNSDLWDDLREHVEEFDASNTLQVAP